MAALPEPSYAVMRFILISSRRSRWIYAATVLKFQIFPVITLRAGPFTLVFLSWLIMALASFPNHVEMAYIKVLTTHKIILANKAHLVQIIWELVSGRGGSLYLIGNKVDQHRSILILAKIIGGNIGLTIVR
jgi:hypothetical protein